MNRAIAPRLTAFAILLLAAPLFFYRGIGVFDDSFYLKAGEEMARGAVLYRDVFENKTPLTFYFAEVIAAVGKGSWLTPRIFLFALAALFFSLFAGVSAALFSKRTAVISSAVFAVSYIIGQGYSLHTEQLCSLSGFAALVCVSGNWRAKTQYWFLSGMFLGLAFLAKQPGVLYFAGILIHAAALALINKEEKQQFLKRFLALAAGVVVTIAIPALDLILKGAGFDSYDAIFLNAKHVSLYVPISFSNAFHLWMKVPAIVMAGIAFAILLVDKNARRELYVQKHVSALALFTITSLICLLPNLRIENTTGHYALPAVAGLSLLVGFVFSLRPILWSSLLIPYILAVSWGGYTMMKEDRLSIDLQQQQELQSILNNHVPKDTPVLCVSQTGTSRLYLMSGHPPFTRYMHFGVNFQDRFTFEDAGELLSSGKPQAAIVDIPTDWDGMNKIRSLVENNFAALPHYEVIPLPHAYHPLHKSTTYVLIHRPK